VSDSITVTRSPNGDPLDADTLAILRALVAERGARRLVTSLGVSLTAIERAAAGGRVLRGTRALIAAGLARMRLSGEFGPKAITRAKDGAR
jgi:hypothetical protein